MASEMFDIHDAALVNSSMRISNFRQLSEETRLLGAKRVILGAVYCPIFSFTKHYELEHLLTSFSQ